MRKLNLSFAVIFTLLALGFSNVSAQKSTGINNINPSKKAALHIKNDGSSKQGIIIPKLSGSDTTSLKAGLTNAEKGLVFYDTTNSVYQYWNGNRWFSLGGNSNTNTDYWATTGNALTTSDTIGAGIKYIGTTTPTPLMFYTGGTERMRLSKTGNLAIGKQPSGGIPLQVKSNGVGTALQIEQATATFPLFEFRQNPNKNAKQLLYDNANNPIIQFSADPLDGSYIRTGNFGIGTISPSVSLDLSSRTDAIALPKGTTLEQPATPTSGMLRYNTSSNSFEGYNGTIWSTFGGGTGDILGTGSVNTVPYWISPKQLGFSTLQTDGITFGIGTPQLSTVTFRISSSLATAVQVINTNATGEAIYGLSNSGSGGVGVHGFASAGKGVYGQAASAIGIGGYFEHSTATGTALATGLGRVGIGTSSPSSLLHVYSGTTDVGISVDAIATKEAAIGFLSAGVVNWSVGRNIQGNFVINRAGAGSELLISSSNGYIGLGVATPLDKLHLGANLRMDVLAGTGKGIVIASSLGVLSRIQGLSTEVVFGDGTVGTLPTGPWTQTATTIYPTDLTKKVGIGIATPGYALHVTDNSTNPGIFTRQDGTGPAIQGNNYSSGIGVQGGSSGSGYAVYANMTGTGTALYATTSGTGSAGIFMGGHVGIGTAAPSSPLTVKATSTAGIGLIGTVSQDLKIYFGGTSNLTFESSGPMEFWPNGGGMVFYLDDGDVKSNVPLSVNGNVTIPAANDYAYLTPKTKYQQIPVTALKAIKNTYDFVLTTYVVGQDGENGYGSIVGGTAGVEGVATAPVYLPDNATITNFEAKLFDADATAGRNITASLARTTFGSINTDLMVSVNTTDADNMTAGGMATRANSTIANPVINNNTYAYYIKVESYQANTNMGIGKIRITYTVTKTD